MSYQSTRPTSSYRCQRCSAMPVAPSGTHQHDVYEIHIHIRGSGELRIGESVLLLRPMMTYVIAPGQPHSIICSTAQNPDYLLLHLPESTLTELSFRGCSLQTELDNIISNFGQCLTLTQELMRSILSLAAEIKDDLPTLAPMERQISLGCLSVILGLLLHGSHLLRNVYVTAGNTLQIVRRVKMHIEQYFREDCSLSHLSELYGISRYHLSRQFTELCGMSLHQYLIRVRITYARRLLQEGEAASDVSTACGFGDYSSFLRAFIRETGQSPSDWKKSHRSLPPQAD